MICPRGTCTVQFPSGRVIDNIFTDAVQGFHVEDNMFVIIALPDGYSWGALQTVSLQNQYVS